VYLEILTREFEVSILDLYDYHEKSADEIANLWNILSSSDPEDIQKCLALLYILTHGKGRDKGVDIEDNYYKCPQLQPFRNTCTDINKYIEKYKMSLLTALLYDDDFYEMVKKWYKNIYAGEAWKNLKNIEYVAAANSVIKNFLDPNIPAAVGFEFDVPGQAAASGVEYEPKAYAWIPVPPLGGQVVFLGIENEGQFQLEVHFEFPTDEGKIPFFLDLNIVPKYIEDGQSVPETIRLRDKVPGKKMAIRSPRHTGINYTKGLKVKISKIISEDYPFGISSV
jgi:hypothetical protein